jgi:hypothetical protein
MVPYCQPAYRTFYGDYATICRAMEYAKANRIYQGSSTSLTGLSKLDIVGTGYDVANIMEHCGGYSALIRPVDFADMPRIPEDWPVEEVGLAAPR